MIRISLWRESLCKTVTSFRRKKKIQKSSTMKITVWDLSGKVNHLIKVVFDLNIVTELHKNRLPSPYDGR